MEIYIWKIPRERYWLSVLQQEYVRPNNGKFWSHIKPIELFAVCNATTLFYTYKLNLFFESFICDKGISAPIMCQKSPVRYLIA